jgi:hypothetical protein
MFFRAWPAGTAGIPPFRVCRKWFGQVVPEACGNAAPTSTESADFPVLRNFAAPVKTFSLFGWPIFRIEESLEKARWPPALLRENI